MTVRINSLNLLYPPIETNLRQAIWICERQGLFVRPFETWRSHARQSYLYAQGRVSEGARVTWVRAGHSYHHYGVAFDLVFDGSSREGVQWCWENEYADDRKIDYIAVSKIVKSFGFEWLGDRGTEMAHFQARFGFTSKEMKQIVDTKGILALWSEFDKVMESNGGKLS